MGAMFIAIVVVFPSGLAGVYRRYVDPTGDRILGSTPKAARAIEAPDAASSVVAD
jgi:urea transport system permease protein